MGCKLFPSAFCLGIILLAILSPSACLHADEDDGSATFTREMATDRIIVKFTEDGVRSLESDGRNRFTRRTSLDRLNSRLGARKTVRTTPETDRRNATVAEELGLDRIYRITFDRAIDPVAVAQTYAALPGVEYAEPDWICRVDWIPNDTYIEQQYGLPYIEAFDAWDTTRGAPEIVVAVIDTGVDATHPELAGKILAGYDFVDGETTMDQYGHGTHVAGIIAAEADNGSGIAGLAPNCRIMPVRVLAQDGEGYVSDCAAGVIWAADNGANVINMSYGSYSYSQTEHNAVAYAIRSGVVCVASKGNDGTWENHYPSDYPGVIAVGAMDAQDQDWLPSNFGPNMWIKAPGENVISTMPTYQVTLTQPPYNHLLNYDYLSGTSTASPHVAAAAALMLSLNSALDPYDVAYLLADSADDMGDVGFDWVYGYGRLNVRQAVLATIADMTHDVSIVATTLTPNDIRVAQAARINVRVRNSGNCTEAPLSVSVFINGELFASETPTLWPGEEITLRYPWIPMEDKTYTITTYCEPLVGTDSNPNDNYGAHIVNPMRFDVIVTGVSVLTYPAYAGALTRIRVTVVNQGNMDEPNVRVKALINDIQIDKQALIPLKVGETGSADFFWEPPIDAASYFKSTPIAAAYTLSGRASPSAGPDMTPNNNYRAMTAHIHAHNMAVTSVSVPGTPESGVPQTIQITVKNKGTRAESDAIVKVYVNGQILPVRIGTALAAGASTVVQFPWTPSQTGDHQIEARIEPTSQPDVTPDDNYSQIGVTVQ